MSPRKDNPMPNKEELEDRKRVDSGVKELEAAHYVGQGGPTSTSCPRARNSLMVASGNRFSTTSTPGRAVRGQNEIGKCSECQAGASMASCRFMPA